jgi:hypothetical protein
MKYGATFLAVLACSLSGWSCGIINSVAVNATTTIVDQGLESVFEESDLGLAGQSIPANLTLVEALDRSSGREDDHLAFLLLEGYTGYSLGFVEDDDPARAAALYRRARDYGLRILKKNASFATVVDSGTEAFAKGVQTFSTDEVPALFWTANAWGNLINVSLADPSAVADLPKVNAMMSFVLTHDESYYYGGAHLYFGTILATIPKMLGGRPDSAKYHFDRCLAIGEGKLLLPYVYMAKSYCVQMQDRALFTELLKKVDEASIDILPEQRLVNAIAKRKAQRLEQRADDLFY